MSSNEHVVVRERHGGDLSARLMGMVIFFVGVGLLLLVFKMAYGLFTASPAAALGINITGDPKRDPAAMLIGQSFGFLLVKILLLFVMSLAASLTSQKGINMYFSGVHNATPRETVKPAAVVSADV